MKKIYTFSWLVVLAISPTFSHAQPFTILKDINSKNVPLINSNPQHITDINGTAYFSSAGDGLGQELWKTDGTVEGTVLVKDINPGLADANPRLLTAMNGKLYFLAKDASNKEALWKSDGTPSGTVLVRQFDFVEEIAAIDNVLFISGIVYGQAELGNQLWKSDGTTEGTVYIKNIEVTAQQLTNLNGVLYFRGNVGAANNALWKSDGTPEGTTVVKSGVNPNLLTLSNGMLFFKGYDGLTGFDLWKTDGTTAGTVLVKDIPWIGFAGSQLVDINGTVYFTANDGITGEDLWKSNGTAQGTVLVKDFTLATDNVEFSGPKSLTDVNGTLFFSVNEKTTGSELWKSDGTNSGTVLVKDIAPGKNGSIDVGFGGVNPSYFTNVNGWLYFVASGLFDGSNTGYELWKSDGTEMGTSLVKNISTLLNRPTQLTNVAGVLYFTADNDTTGRLVWKTDGSEAGTNPIKNLNGSVAANSEPFELTNVNGVLAFTANDGIGGRQIWKTDGTAANTNWFGGEFPDGYPYYYGGEPSGLTASGNSLYFTARGEDEFGNSTISLYISGLQNMYQEYGPPSYPLEVGPDNLTDVNGTLYFVANSGYSTGFEVMKSNGQGTSILADIKQSNDFGSPECPGGTSCLNIASPQELINIEGTLYFSAFDDENGYQIWKSDGNTTTVLKAGVNGRALTKAGSLLYFFNGSDLWVSDGSEAGTKVIKNVGLSDALPTRADVNGLLFFTMVKSNQLSELWKSNGTESGTVMVKSFNTVSGSALGLLTNLNGILFFRAKTDDFGEELWKSDGTGQGTQLVKDIIAGSESSVPYAFYAIGNQLLFRADDGTHGNEIWRSDGTPDGTFMIQDAEPGPVGSNPQYPSSTPPKVFIEVNGKVFTSLKTSTYGTELWVANDVNNLCPATAGRLYVNSAVGTSGSGGTWQCAIKELRDAVTIANADTSIKEIWVAAGVYKPTDGNDQNISITIKRNNLTLMGGFNGSETNILEASPQTNQTIISGDIGVLDVSTDNSYYVLRVANTNSAVNSLQIDGFIIEKGYSASPGGKKQRPN